MVSPPTSFPSRRCSLFHTFLSYLEGSSLIAFHYVHTSRVITRIAHVVTTQDISSPSITVFFCHVRSYDENLHMPNLVIEGPLHPCVPVSFLFLVVLQFGVWVMFKASTLDVKTEN